MSLQSAPYEHDGVCPICGKQTRFVWYDYAQRDSLLCSSCPCPSVPRERALVMVLSDEAPNWRELSIHESSPADRGASRKLRNECAGYIGTQLMKNVPLGQSANGFRCENLEQQTFTDACFDIVVTLDVMEHVNQPDQVIREIWRTLKPGGLYVFTTPTYKYNVNTTRRASYDAEGRVSFVGEPEYHGNPVDPEGSPVTFHFGYDLPQLINSWADFDVKVIRFWDHEHGVLGEMTEVYVCRKRGRHPWIGGRETEGVIAPSTSIQAAFATASEDQWLSALQRSVREPIIAGAEFPRFPHSSVQAGFNGASDEEAMRRAHGLWLYASRWSSALNQPLVASSRVLDVGCGWGRITRTFAKDVAAENIFGCDIDAEAVQLCRFLGVPGHFVATQPNEPLPFEADTFSVITAYSVFTHLPEPVSRQLLSEMCRVTQPGGLMIFTVEDDTFFSYFSIPGIEAHSERWRLLSRHKQDIPRLAAEFAAGRYVYLSTNDETVRSSAVYGDAIVPRGWFEEQFGDRLDVLAYQKSVDPIFQAARTAARHRDSR